jgi:hypothetical protein
MGRGAQTTRTGGQIAVSIPLSNVRLRVQETADFATATLGQGIASNGEAGVEPSLLPHWHHHRPNTCDEEQS